MSTLEKRCIRCKASKPLTEFYKDKLRKDGLRQYCKSCEAIMSKGYRTKNIEGYKAYCRGSKLKRKILVLTHYGNGKLACVRCGYSDVRALTIDHIWGGGRNHAKEIGSGGSLYGWLKKNNFPNGFQTLCANCQLLKREENNENRK